jgi:anti-sigma B factor antagonist
MTAISIHMKTDHDGVSWLAVAGEVDLVTSRLVSVAIRIAITASNATELVVDLGQVTFLDAAGIGALVAGRHLAAERGMAYRVTNPHGIVREVLDIAGFLSGLAVHASTTSLLADRYAGSQRHELRLHPRRLTSCPSLMYGAGGVASGRARRHRPRGTGNTRRRPPAG